MGLKKFFKKAGKDLGNLFEGAANNVVPLIAGDLSGALGGLMPGASVPHQATTYLPAAAPALPPGAMVFTKEERRALRQRVRENTRARLLGKMDLAPGLPMDKVMIGVAVVAAGGALLYVARGK